MAKQAATKNHPYYIYALTHPLSRQIGYVGMTINPRHRFMQHVCSKGETLKRRSAYCLKSRWIYSLVRKGLLPNMEILEVMTKGSPSHRERSWQWWVRDHADVVPNFELVCKAVCGWELPRSECPYRIGKHRLLPASREHMRDFLRSGHIEPGKRKVAGLKRLLAEQS